MKAEINAEFRVIGSDDQDDLDPDEITALLGIAPVSTWRIGDQRGRSPTVRYRYSGWFCDSGLPQSADVEAHTTALLERLAPVWPAAVAIGARHYTEVAFVIYSHGPTQPALVFDGASVKRIAELNAALDVSFYYFGDGEEEADTDEQ